MHKVLAGAFLLINFAAFSSSTNYQLKSYGVNSGGTNTAASSTYTLQAATGEVGGSVSAGPTYKINSTAIQAQQTNVPGAPTLSNNSGGYTDRLKFILNTQNNPSDTVYVVAVSTDSGFSSVNYVQADGTLGSSQVFQTYALWGGGSGAFALGLSSNTTYYFKVAAMQGQFTATGFGPAANQATASPALSFSLSPSTLDLGNLEPGAVVNSPSNISFTFTTNAPFGGSIYVAGSSTGLSSSAASYNLTITPPSGDLSSLSEGFGLRGLSASSPLAIQSPYAGSGNVVGAIYTTFQPLFTSPTVLSSGSATAVIKAKASNNTPVASDYSDTLTFVAAASY